MTSVRHVGYWLLESGENVPGADEPLFVALNSTRNLTALSGPVVPVASVLITISSSDPQTEEKGTHLATR